MPLVKRPSPKPQPVRPNTAVEKKTEQVNKFNKNLKDDTE